MISDTFSYKFNEYRTRLWGGNVSSPPTSFFYGTAAGPNAKLDSLDPDYDNFFQGAIGTSILFPSGSVIREAIIQSGIRVFGNNFTHYANPKYIERIMKRFDELAVEHDWINEDPEMFSSGSTGFDWKVYYGGYSFPITPSSGFPYQLTNHRLSDDRFWKYLYTVANYVYDKTTAIDSKHLDYIDLRQLCLYPVNGEFSSADIDFSPNGIINFGNNGDYNARIVLPLHLNSELYSNYPQATGILGTSITGVSGTVYANFHELLSAKIPSIFWNPDSSGTALLLNQPLFERVTYHTYSGVETQYRYSFAQVGTSVPPTSQGSTISAILAQGGDDLGNTTTIPKLYRLFLGHITPYSGTSFNTTLPLSGDIISTTLGTLPLVESNVRANQTNFNSGIVYGVVPSLFPTRWNTITKSSSRNVEIIYGNESGIGGPVGGLASPSAYAYNAITPASGVSEYITDVENVFNSRKWVSARTGSAISINTTWENLEGVPYRSNDILSSQVTVITDDSYLLNDGALKLEPFIGNNDRIFVEKNPAHNVIIHAPIVPFYLRFPGSQFVSKRCQISMNSSVTFMLIPVSLRGNHLTEFSYRGVHHKLNDHYLDDKPQSLRSLMGFKTEDLNKMFISYYLKPQNRMASLDMFLRDYGDEHYNPSQMYPNFTYSQDRVYVPGRTYTNHGTNSNAGVIGYTYLLSDFEALYNNYKNSVSYADLELVYGYIDVIEDVDMPNLQMLDSGNYLLPQSFRYHPNTDNPRPFIRPYGGESPIVGDTTYEKIYASGTYISDIVMEKLENGNFDNIFDIEVPEQETRDFSDFITLNYSPTPAAPPYTHIGDETYDIDPTYNFNDLKYTTRTKTIDFPYARWFDTIPPSGATHMFIAIKPKNMRTTFLANISNTQTISNIKYNYLSSFYLSGTTYYTDYNSIDIAGSSFECSDYAEHVGGAYLKSAQVVNSVGLPAFKRKPVSGEIWSRTSAIRNYQELPNDEYVSNRDLLEGYIYNINPTPFSPINLSNTLFGYYVNPYNNILGDSAKVQHWWRYGASKMLYDMRQSDPDTNNLVSIFDKFYVTTPLNMYGIASGNKRDDTHTAATYTPDTYDKINGNMCALLFKQNGVRYQPVPINPNI